MPASTVDWSACPLVEIDPQRVGGRPVLKGTRMPVEDLIANFDYGVSVAEISEQFGIPPETITQLLSDAGKHDTIAHPLR